MNFKRILFISVLFVLFICCFQIMNQHYDELSRYQYTSDENRDLILEHMSEEEINYLIERQYEPSQFIHYLGIEGFTILNLDWYNYSLEKQAMELDYIVQIVNELHEKMTFSTFKNYCENYSVSDIYDFYFSNDSYTKNLTLIEDLSIITNKINEKYTLFTYEPNDLTMIEDIPVLGKDPIYIRKEVNDALLNVCVAAKDINDKQCGNMIVSKGYMFYEEQISTYEDALIKYGVGEVLKHVDYPGQSIYQLGTYVNMIPTGIEDEDEMSLQQQWLKVHAKEYGFEFVNDSNDELTEFVLRYVGRGN